MGDAMNVEVKDIDKLFQMDGYLKPFEREIRRRWVEKFIEKRTQKEQKQKCKQPARRPSCNPNLMPADKHPLVWNGA